MSPIAAALASTTSPANIFYTLIARDSIGNDFNNFKDSFSSWDSCMSKAYCKWPVIVAIIIGSLIVLSLLISLARCLCCGLECCFACCACCNACCPSPRGSSRKDSGGTYKQPAQQQPMWPQPYGFVQPMAYGPVGGNSGTATFDAPSRNTGGGAVVREDSLPMMPTWETSQSRRVEDPDAEPEEEVHNDQEHSGTIGGGQQSYAMTSMSPAGNGPPSPQRAPSPYADEARQSLLAPQPQRPIHQSALQSPLQNPYRYQDTSYASPARSQHQQQQSQSYASPYGASELDTQQPQHSSYATNPYHDNYNSYGYNDQMQSPSSHYPTPAPSYHTQMASPYQQRQAYPPPGPQRNDYTYGGGNAYTQQTQYQPQYQGQEIGTEYNAPSGRWGESSPVERRPVNGSWREV